MEVSDLEVDLTREAGSASLDEVSAGPAAVNIYGSPIALARPGRDERSSVVPLESLGRLVCSCKNTCSRKKGARTKGCPCKNASQKCSKDCKCGTKKAACKNKETVEVINRNPSAFARHQIEVENAEREIKVFIEQLPVDDKDRLLLRLLSQGRGSLEFAKNMLEVAEGEKEPETNSGPGHPGWCVCGVCRAMPLEIENVCCKKITCVTSYALFNNICLDREVLTLAIRARCDIRADEADYSSNSFRKAAYRQYCLWKYGKLGRGNRRILPSCVVLMIRQSYPAPDGVYMGYRQA